MHLRCCEAENGIDRVACRLPFFCARLESMPALAGQPIVLSGRSAVTRGPMGVYESVALKAAEQRIDRSLTDDRKAALAETLGHLVAIGGVVAHDGQETQVEDPPQ